MSRPAALVSAARGIGDILRITPLVRVCVALGYDVDLLLAPDYPGVAELLETSDGIRRVFLLPGPWSGAGEQRIDGLNRTIYDVATFTLWSLPFRNLVRARRTLAFDQAPWINDGDTAAVRRLAAGLGWTAPLPPPFARPSSRQFALPAGTVALHPGCKPDWPWKKWHGFEDLARRLRHVVIVGLPHDSQNERTYFRRTFVWPSHVHDYAGALSLSDTAALISQCAALVANDSGLMHLGVALGVPTFGIFGITSPARESIDSPHMIPITKGLPCEPACRRGPWGRRDCEHHLQCLRTLSADEVHDRIETIVPVKACAI
jgi:glycosyl transferase family 9 (putative heptosyltransferase)